MDDGQTFKIEIVRRTWYEWVAWALWFLSMLFILQNAIASRREYEASAATIFWAIEVVLLIGGGVVWYVRRQRLLN
jgi:hypothetical protein